MIGDLDRLVRSAFSSGPPLPRTANFSRSEQIRSDLKPHTARLSGNRAAVFARALRPGQWIKNGVVFAGLVFGGKLLDPAAVANAVLAAIWFCLLSSGFYLINDVRDRHADRLHPDKRKRPVAARELSPRTACVVGAALVVVALAGSVFLGQTFLLVALSYAALMAAYNLVLKQIVILDVFAIAVGFVLRAMGGAIAVAVTISPWLLVCALVLALLLGFGKRRHELLSLEAAKGHRANLERYTERMLDQAVAVSAAGALLAYAVYTLDRESPAFNHRMVVTVPIVAYGIFRYLFLVYGRGKGGAPESMLLADRSLLGAVVMWSLTSVVLFYLAS